MTQTGSEWLSNCQENAGNERDAYLLQACSDGLLNCDWSDIVSEIDGHQATFTVSSDALYILLDDSSRFRPQGCATVAQKIADQLNVSMVTTKIMDLRYSQAGMKQNATILPAGPQMSTTSYSKTWNEKLEIKRSGFTGLFADTGKPFILDNKLAYSAGACLYGFFDTSASSVSPCGLKLWQTVGTHHDHYFSDYSSTMMFMKKECIVDEQSSDIQTIFSDIELSKLVNYDGILKYTRLP